MAMITYAFRELVRRPRRALAAMAGYAIACGFLGVLLGSLENQTRVSDSLLTGTGTHFIAYIPLCGNETCGAVVLDPAEGFFANTVKTKLIDYDLALLAAQSPAVRDASAFLLFKLSDDSGRSLFLGGVPSSDAISVKNNSCSATDVVAGRFLAPQDRGAVILEESFAQANSLSINSELSFAGDRFTVVGVVNPGIRPAKADVYMPRTEADRVISSHLRIPLDDQFNILLVESAGATTHEEAMRDVKKVLGNTSLISTYGCFKPASLVLGINTAGFTLVSVVIYLSLLGFALKSQYASVLERRHEIGILFVVGWKKPRIIFQILLESLLQATMGWFTGSVIALAVLLVLPPSLFGLGDIAGGFSIPWTAFLFCLLISLSGGIIAGIIPGAVQARTKPANSLRRM